MLKSVDAVGLYSDVSYVESKPSLYRRNTQEQIYKIKIRISMVQTLASGSIISFRMFIKTLIPVRFVL